MSVEGVNVLVNGESVIATRGVTVAAALLNANVASFRLSVSGEPRGPVCGMGICYECRVTVDGVDHQRACMRIVTDGMRIHTSGARAR